MTQQSDAPPPQIVSASRPPLRVSGWALWRWSLLLLAAATTLAYEGHALLRLSFGVSAEHPAHEDGAAVRAGSRALALTVLLPWALACRVVRRRLRVIVAALVCAVPVIWFWRYVHAG